VTSIERIQAKILSFHSP